MCPPETHGQEDEQKEGGEKERSGGDDSRCVNHYGGGTERHRGAEGVSLMRWKQSNWHALFLRLAEATLGPRQEGRVTDRK